MKKVEYSIKKHDKKYVIWKDVEITKEQKGSYGCYNIYSGTLKKCREYAKKHRIRIKRNNSLLKISL